MGVSTGTDEGPPERGGNHRETGADKGWDGNQDDYQQKGRVLSRLDLCISQQSFNERPGGEAQENKSACRHRKSE
jgi:hypothetical protein